jgi:two-component system, sensor histidine kinase and response regulator
MARTRGEPKRVLVVDDDASNAESLGELLAEAAGYTISVFSSAEAALAHIEHSPADAALLDVEMHGMSGLELLRTLRTRYSALELPVVMVTGHDSGREVAAALHAGANDYVTKPVDLEVLLARLATHLHLADLARLKDDMLRMASHDLKNPLTAVIGNARLIVETELGQPVDAELHGCARAILRRAAYMQRLVNDFLDLQAARDGQLRLERVPVPLLPLLASIAAEQEDYAKTRALELRVTGTPAVALADAARLTQVLHNLVGNALKFSHRGGRVELSCASEAGHAVIEVRDQGPGLGEHPEQLFAQGQRGPARSSSERSTGLGLYIARVLVTQHGGTISARNREDGPGALFRVELPAAA